MISAIDQWPSWNPNVKSVALQGPVQPGTVFRWKRFHHPVVGDMELAFESFPLAADPSQSLLTYTAEPGSRSQDALRLLASWAATTDDTEPASTDDSEQAESVETPD